MNTTDLIYVAGHNGLVGSAMVRKLREKGFNNLALQTHQELDLTNRDAVFDFFFEEVPKHVVLAAAKVGGIHANNTAPVAFISDNLLIQTNVIDAAYDAGVEKLIFLGSSCIYPRNAKQPIREESLLTSKLEPTNEPYAIAKIAGIILCKSHNRQHRTNFLAAMPTNLYGPNDNFDLETSHVLPALIRRFHEAKVANAPHVTLWGSGTPLREFLHVDDLAAALFVLLTNYDELPGEDLLINIGYGDDIPIAHLAILVKKVVGYTGDIVWDKTKPDGTRRKLMSSRKMFKLGWRPQIPLHMGVKSTYEWYLENL
jgi:GDP-L-fucose synthase